MDSLSQIALGAAVGVAVMGRRTAVWKAALWGAVAGTLPDLDVFVDQGDPIRNMVLHRAESHALFWLTLFSLPFSALVAWLSSRREPGGAGAVFKRWWLAMWLALVTHPLLDTMTVYGTQLGLPFTNYPFGVGSVFIIDPAYTVPLLVGCVWALLARGSTAGRMANLLGLLVSTAYLGWSFAAQQHVKEVATAALAARGITAERLLVTPTAFNTALWRVVAMEGDAYHEGFYSLLDRPAPAGEPQVAFDRYARGNALLPELANNDGVQRLRKFTHGFFALRQDGTRLLITDLRMGQEPIYTFKFVVADRSESPLKLPQQLQGRPDIQCALPWLWQRAQGEPLPSLAKMCAPRPLNSPAN